MKRALSWLVFCFASPVASAQHLFVYDDAIDCYSCGEWNAPQQPFRIFGNSYYVGTAGLSAILIDTGDGLILLDGGLPQSAELIVANIEELGFSIDDVRLIGMSHAHFDHVGGLAALQRLSGAIVMTSPPAATALHSGELSGNDPQFDPDTKSGGFPEVTLVEEIENGDSLSIGTTQVRANYTPGHTPGGISWSWLSCEKQRCLSVVYADSLSAVSSPEFRFSDSGSDGAGESLRRSIELIAELDCDVFLAPHPFLFDIQGKYGEWGELNPFIDAQGCREYASSAMRNLDRRLASEQDEES